MRDVVTQVQEGDLGDYQYLSQFAPDAEGMTFNDEFPFFRMAEVYDLNLVPDGISGDRQMREYLETDLLDGAISRDHFARGLSRAEFNDLQNYHAWNVYDALALRAQEGKSEIIPRQEYEALSFAWAMARWPEFFKLLIHTVGIDGLLAVGRESREELATGLTTLTGWTFLGVPSGGSIGWDLLELIDPDDPVHVEQRKVCLTTAAALMYATFDETGYLYPSQNRYVNGAKSPATVEYVLDNLQDIGEDERSTFRRANAALELLSFLMHYDNRVGLIDNGPYLVEDGKPLLMRDVLLNRPFLPWNDIAADRDMPYGVTVAMVLDPDAIDLQEIRCPLTTVTAPADYLAAVERGGMFVREELDQVGGIDRESLSVPDLDEMADLAGRANDAVIEWYERTTRLSRRQKVINGAITYYVGMLVPLLRKTGTYDYVTDELDLWELPPLVADNYYLLFDGFAQEEVPAQIGTGTGWSDFPETPNDSSDYADYLESARDLNWQSDLTGLEPVPEYWADLMDDNRLLDVPLTTMSGEVDPAGAASFLEGR